MLYGAVVWKTLLTFAALWGLTRILGKKQIGQLTLFDFITAITVGTIAGSMILPRNPTGPLLLSLALWGALSFAMHRLDVTRRSVHRVLDGTPTVLIRNGKILEENLKKVELPVEQLAGLLRAKGYFNPSAIEFALMETSGAISVLPKSQYRPVQPRDLGIDTGYEGVPTQVMKEGKPLPEALQSLQLTEEWLQGELQKQNTQPEQVFAAWLGTDGHLYVDRYQDGPPWVPPESPTSPPNP